MIAVWSECVPEELKEFKDSRITVAFEGSVQHEAGQVSATVAAVKSLVGDRRLRGVIVGCETGVLLGDELSEALAPVYGVRTNGTALSQLRRNKWLQTEAVRDAGLGACTQYLANSDADVERVLNAWPAGALFKAVVKPVVGAGSDGVTICNSKEEVRAAFRKLDGTKNVLGLTTYEVLIQEYLLGEEYVVDTVTRDGVHKCVAIWKYDKRTYNGSPVVYYGMKLLDIDAEPELRRMVEYTTKVLGVLGIRDGAMHTEIKLETRGPILIEVNCRLHGGEGTWAPMAEAAIGYSAVSVLLDATLDAAAFEKIPMAPSGFKAAAREAKLRSPVEGLLKSINRTTMQKIRSLPSYRSEMLTVEAGKPIAKTIDAVSACGNINLVHRKVAQLDKDYSTLHQLVETDLFELEPEIVDNVTPSTFSLASFLHQSPPTSPTARAFRALQPSPPTTPALGKPNGVAPRKKVVIKAGRGKGANGNNTMNGK